MEHLSNDNEDHPNQHENCHKLVDEIVFLLFHVGKKSFDIKLYKGFHTSKNGIRISNFQKIVFLQIFN